MTGLVRYIPADSSRPETSENYNDQGVMAWFPKARTYVQGDIEVVWVLHTGRKTLMLVNDKSALDPPMMVNHRATHIYHAASRAHGRSVKDAPFIYGNAVLFENIDAD